MNKKEQAAFDELQNELRLAKAMRDTRPVAPDIPPPTEFGQPDTTGFHFNVYSNSVQPCASSSMSHNWGAATMLKFGNTKGALGLYSTRHRALQALRHEVEKECAARLAAIDKQIEAENSPAPLAP